MSEIRFDDIVFDKAIYPRGQGDEGTVHRYAEAMSEGAEFPPIVLETGTGRLIDGWHRVHAAQRIERESLPADWHTIPHGMDARLYAASLSAKHGLPIRDDDLRQLARALYEADPDMKVTEVAQTIGRARQTVQGWVQDLSNARHEAEERERAARRTAVALLREAGWNQTEVGEFLDMPQRTVSSDAEVGTDANDLDEGILRAALDLIPCDIRADAESVAEEWREERIFAAWSNDERDLLKQLRDGQTVVVSYRVHGDLIAWADQADLLVRIDRRSDWGNPFLLDEDGDRETVVGNYEEHYLWHKPSLISRLGGLNGKALACWCAPELCHGDVLKERAEEC